VRQEINGAIAMEKVPSPMAAAIGGTKFDALPVHSRLFNFDTVIFAILRNFYEVYGEAVLFCYLFRVLKDIVAFKHKGIVGVINPASLRIIFIVSEQFFFGLTRCVEKNGLCHTYSSVARLADFSNYRS
jgi:hypothetical protein